MSEESKQASPSPAAKQTAREQTVIGSDTHVKGEMTFDHDCRVLGHFEGSITSEGQLHVAEGATCKAEVEAESLVIDGTVEGNVTARQRVKLNASAKVNGDIVAATVEIAEGAQISGHVSVGPDQQPTQRGGPRLEPEAEEAPEPASTSTSASGAGSGSAPAGRRAISHKPSDTVR